MRDEQLDSLFEQDTPKMPAMLADTIRARIQSETRPVKPMMSVGAYALLFGGICAVMATLFASLIGFKGLHVLSPMLAATLLGALLALAWWSALMVARGMRPAGGRLHSWLSVGLALVAYESLVLTLFHDLSINRFVQQGVVCLSIGLLCAVCTAAPTWFIVRRGFIVDSVRMGAVFGLAAGLAGLAALTLHCPIINAPHALVWHAAVVVFCVAAGALTGRIFQRRRVFLYG